MTYAAEHGHFEVIKTLAPLSENPNASVNCYYFSPISSAVRNGHLEIIKFLVPLSENLTSEAIEEARVRAALYDHNHVVNFFTFLLP